MAAKVKNSFMCLQEINSILQQIIHIISLTAPKVDCLK